MKFSFLDDFSAKYVFAPFVPFLKVFSIYSNICYIIYFYNLIEIKRSQRSQNTEKPSVYAVFRVFKKGTFGTEKGILLKFRSQITIFIFFIFFNLCPFWFFHAFSFSSKYACI